MGDRGKILVTGAGGFLGAHLVSTLAKNGFEVVGISRKIISDSGAKYFKLDFTKEDLPEVALTGTDAVVHAAALLSSDSIAKKDDFYRVNVLGTKKILREVKSAGIKQFIFISSAHVHGPNPARCANENDAYNPRPSSWYEWSKIEAEKEVIKFCRENNLMYTIIRLGQLYGPGMIYGWPKVFRAMECGHFFVLNGKGTIQPLYIGDAVQVVLRCVNNPRVNNEIFLAAGREKVRLGDLFGQMAEILGVGSVKRIPYFLGYLAALALKCFPISIKNDRMKLVTLHNVKFFRENRCYNINKMNRLLDFLPVIGLGAGLKSTIEWYGRHK